MHVPMIFDMPPPHSMCCTHTDYNAHADTPICYGETYVYMEVIIL